MGDEPARNNFIWHALDKRIEPHLSEDQRKLISTPRSRFGKNHIRNRQASFYRRYFIFGRKSYQRSVLARLEPDHLRCADSLVTQ